MSPWLKMTVQNSLTFQILVRERNAIEARITRLLDRPASVGGIGEWIAARIFYSELEEAANAAGYDGWFTTGSLSGKTVNVKTYTRDERILDILDMFYRAAIAAVDEVRGKPAKRLGLLPVAAEPHHEALSRLRRARWRSTRCWAGVSGMSWSAFLVPARRR